MMRFRGHSTRPRATYVATCKWVVRAVASCLDFSRRRLRSSQAKRSRRRFARLAADRAATAALAVSGMHRLERRVPKLGANGRAAPLTARTIDDGGRRSDAATGRNLGRIVEAIAARTPRQRAHESR